MKSIAKKTLCFSLCLLTIFSAFPIGSFQASASATVDETSDDEVVISSLSDWNTVANSGTTHAKKTIKLGNDIDAGGELLPTLFSKFSGTFDGQGYEIRNFRAEEALLAVRATTNVTIKNLNISGGSVTGSRQNGVGLLIGDFYGAGSLTVQDCFLSASVTSYYQIPSSNKTGSHVGGVIGALSLSDGASACFERLNIDVTVKNESTFTLSAWQSAGGVIGIFEPDGRPNLTLSCINIKGSVLGGTKTTAGGLIGSVFSKAAQCDLYAGGSITISNCQSALSVASDSEFVDLGVGGVIGAFGASSKYCNDSAVYEGTLTIDNCLIGGSVAQTHTAQEIYACGGVIGIFGYGDAEAHINHCLVTADFPSNSLALSNGQGAGLIVGQVATVEKSSLFINNTVTTKNEPFYLINALAAKPRELNIPEFYPWLNLNRVNLGAVPTKETVLEDSGNATTLYFLPAVSDNSVLSIADETAAQMVKKDARGFLTRIGGQITAMAVQDNVSDGATLSEGDSYAIRFIATSQLAEVSDAKLTVIVRDAITQDAFKKYTATCNLYDALSAYNDEGKFIKAYHAIDFGAKKFLALIIDNIPAGAAYTFEVTPEFTTDSGLKVTGETISVTYDQNGKIIMDKISLDVVPYEETALKIRVLSSNVLAHAASNAGDSGISTDQRLKNLATAFLFYDPDFIGLQEMQEQNSVNGLPYNMQTKILTHIGSEYTMVNFRDKVPASVHWTPMYYKTDRWTLIECDIDTEIVNEMHRWQWAVYQSKIDPEVYFIHANLHLIYVRPEEYAELSNEILALANKYPNAPIAVGGDYNANLGSYPGLAEAFAALVGKTELKNSIYMAEDNESLMSTCTDYIDESRSTLYDKIFPEAMIDHMFVTKNNAEVLKHRVLRNVALGKASDHYPIYTDIILMPSNTSNGSSMDWENGTIIF